MTKFRNAIPFLVVFAFGAAILAADHFGQDASAAQATAEDAASNLSEPVPLTPEELAAMGLD